MKADGCFRKSRLGIMAITFSYIILNVFFNFSTLFKDVCGLQIKSGNIGLFNSALLKVYSGSACPIGNP